MPLLKAGEVMGHLLNSAGPRVGALLCVQGLLCAMDSGIADEPNYQD